jgi:LytS/YehU family sensor histidine kinase
VVFGAAIIYLTHVFIPGFDQNIEQKEIIKRFLSRFLAIAVITFILSYRKKFIQIKDEKTKAELETLKSQINPHFLFNTLNDIYGLAIIKSDNTANSISKLSNMMRYILTETKAEKVSLERELNYLKTYVELQKIRLTEKTKINFHIDGSSLQKQIPPLLFINFIENAFKYGVSNEFETNIDVSIIIDDNNLELRVKNDIVKSQPDLKSNNFGLENVKRRLNLLYPASHSVDIKNNDKTFELSLKIKDI